MIKSEWGWVWWEGNERERERWVGMYVVSGGWLCMFLGGIGGYSSRGRKKLVFSLCEEGEEEVLELVKRVLELG